MKRLLFVLSFLLVPVAAFAQDELPVDEPINFLLYAALAINAALVPLAADLLKKAWKTIPSWLMTLVPLFAGSLIVMAETYLSGVFPVPIDLDLIEQVLLGGGAGVASTVAFKFGEKHAQ